jgi:hypothetical protein
MYSHRVGALGTGSIPSYIPVSVTGGALANKIIADAVTGYQISLVRTQDNKLIFFGSNSNGMFQYQ